MKSCYYCHKKIYGYCHYVVTADGKLVPVCADDRACKPRAIQCHGTRPKIAHKAKNKALERNRRHYED
nr:MAG TPA: hypothetical protein [Caudoviricetes sp.]